MRHGSLFSGIGGFDIAAEWMGWENVFHCEWNEFGQSILKYYWPKAKSYGDIKQTDFTIYRGQIDVLSGGFPCQPYSLAGKRLGKEDDRHLWPEMLRAIREIQPRWVVGENVRGLISWNGGMVFDEVQSELEAIGYEVLPFLLPACAKDAPHKRDRIWFVAYADEFRLQSTRNAWEGRNGLEIKDIITDTYSGRQSSQEHRKEKSRQFTEKSVSNYWTDFPTQSPICSGDDGIPTELDAITFPKWRNESIKAFGNAVVPQVVYEIFKAIQKYERSIW